MSDNSNVVAKEFHSIMAKRIDGIKALIVEEKTDYYKYVYTFDENGKRKLTGRIFECAKKEEISYPLHPIAAYELEKIRKSGTSGFILKREGNLYFTKISSRVHFLEDFGINAHKCGECNRMYALPDNMGGCRKVRDRHFHIEYYSFITDGYEIFNTNNNKFHVDGCKHWAEIPKREKTTTDINGIFNNLRLKKSKEYPGDEDNILDFFKHNR